MAGDGGSFIIKNVPSRENKNLESSKLVDHLKVIFTGVFVKSIWQILAIVLILFILTYVGQYCLTGGRFIVTKLEMRLPINLFSAIPFFKVHWKVRLMFWKWWDTYLAYKEYSWIRRCASSTFWSVFHNPRKRKKNLRPAAAGIMPTNWKFMPWRSTRFCTWRGGSRSHFYDPPS